MFYSDTLFLALLPLESFTNRVELVHILIFNTLCWLFICAAIHFKFSILGLVMMYINDLQSESVLEEVYYHPMFFV
jgi:hypothetical protein